MYSKLYSVSLRIQFECGKIRTRITPNTDTFNEVLAATSYCYFNIQLIKLYMSVCVEGKVLMDAGGGCATLCHHLFPLKALPFCLRFMKIYIKVQIESNIIETFPCQRLSYSFKERSVLLRIVVYQTCSVKKAFLETLQNSQKNSCARVSILIKKDFGKKQTLAQVFSCEFCEIFKNTFSYRTLFTEHL